MMIIYFSKTYNLTNIFKYNFIHYLRLGTAEKIFICIVKSEYLDEHEIGKFVR